MQESGDEQEGTCLAEPPTRGRYARGFNAISIQAFQQDQNRRSRMMKPLLLTAALGILAGGALAQNTKGTGADPHHDHDKSRGIGGSAYTLGWGQPCGPTIRHGPPEYESDEIGTRSVQKQAKAVLLSSNTRISWRRRRFHHRCATFGG